MQSDIFQKRENEGGKKGKGGGNYVLREGGGGGGGGVLPVPYSEGRRKRKRGGGREEVAKGKRESRPIRSNPCLSSRGCRMGKKKKGRGERGVSRRREMKTR